MTFLRHSDISLYVHIPFCTSRCRYCSFYFETGWSSRVMQNTLDGIVAEASRAAATGMLGPNSIRSIYIGGGTPSTVPPVLLEAFLGRLRTVLRPHLGELEEFCVECNPESLSRELLEVLDRAGTDRVSLGVQTFDTEFLRLLGRRADKPIVLQAFDLLDAHWTRETNLDFIAGIPGQSVEHLVDDLKQATAWGPEHISLYSLTVEDRTPFQQLVDLPVSRGGIGAPNQDHQDEVWLAGRDFLASEGYANYEVSNFARPGFESAHNLRYWRTLPYLGLGPGAVSLLLTGEGPVRHTNPSVFEYARPGNSSAEPKREMELLSPRQWLSEHFITGTRSTYGLRSDLVDSRFLFLGDDSGRRTVWDLVDSCAAGWIARGLRIPDPSALVLSAAGRLIQNRLLLELESAVDTALSDGGLCLGFRQA